MIDPINSLPLQRPTTTNSDSTDRSRKGKGISIDSTSSDARLQSVKDSVSFSFNLRGDLTALRDAVATVFEQVKQQLQTVYGMRGGDPEADPSKYLPPENASAQELADFFSPENTANRILKFTTGFFNLYKANHTNSSEEENINKFSTLIGDAIKKGFKEAEKILGSYDELGQIGENIKRTYSLVMKELEDFRLTHLNDLGLTSKEPETPIEKEVEETLKPDTETNLDLVG